MDKPTTPLALSFAIKAGDAGTRQAFEIVSDFFGGLPSVDGALSQDVFFLSLWGIVSAAVGAQQEEHGPGSADLFFSTVINIMMEAYMMGIVAADVRELGQMNDLLEKARGIINN